MLALRYLEIIESHYQIVRVERSGVYNTHRRRLDITVANPYSL